MQLAIFFAILLIVHGFLTVANYQLSLCQSSGAVEWFLGITSWVALGFFPFSLIVLGIWKGVERRRVIPLFFLAFFLGGPTFWSTSSRQHANDIQEWSFDEIVTDKFNSSNHGARTLSIGGTDYEFFPADLWEKVEIGDTISKTSCSSDILLDGAKYPFPEWRQ
jgi:hypothetical protein